MEMNFYVCKKCGNIVGFIDKSSDNMTCCGELLEKIDVNKEGADLEKHVPVYRMEANKVIVNIGEKEHPMTKEHHIKWVFLKSRLGNQRKELDIYQDPTVTFSVVAGDEVEKVYAFCNIHGLFVSK